MAPGNGFEAGATGGTHAERGVVGGHELAALLIRTDWRAYVASWKAAGDRAIFDRPTRLCRMGFQPPGLGVRVRKRLGTARVAPKRKCAVSRATVPNASESHRVMLN